MTTKELDELIEKIESLSNTICDLSKQLRREGYTFAANRLREMRYTLLNVIYALMN